MQIFKKLSLILFAILAILIIAIAILLFVVDPNRYKSRIEDFAENRANMSLQIKGNLSWTLFPWLGISIEDTQISALHDIENPVASAHTLSLSLKLIPLVKGDIEIDQLQVDGLNIDIKTYEDGSQNIDGFFANSKKKSTPIDAQNRPNEIIDQSDNSPQKHRELNIRAINFSNSQLTIENQKTKQIFSGNNIDFTIQNIHRNAEALTIDSVSFESGTLLFSDQLKQQQLSYQEIHFDLGNFSIRHQIENLERQFALSLGKFNFKQGNIHYLHQETGQEIRLNPRAINIKNFFYSNFTQDQERPWNIDQILVKDLSYYSQKDPNNPPIIINATNIQLSDFNPQSQAMLNFEIAGEQQDQLKFKITGNSLITAQNSLLNWQFKENNIIANVDQLPSLTLPKSLPLQLKGTVNLDLEHDTLSVTPLTLQIDESTITGDITLSSLQKQQGVINLQGDSLNLNHYLPTNSQNAPNTRQESSSKQKDQPQIDNHKERALTINATLQKLTIGDLQAQNLQLKALLQNERMTISEAKTNLLGGIISAKGNINIQPATPIIAGDISVNALPLTNLFNLLQKKIPITGNLNFNGKLQTEGFDGASILNHLQGNFQANITNGQLIGVDYEALVCEGFSLIKKENFRKNSGAQTTSFKILNGAATIKNGVITNNNLQMEIPGLAANGSGSINLNNETLNYRIGLLLKESTGVPNCKIDQYLKNVTIPLHCQGSYLNANSSLCGLDQNAIGNIIADLAKNKIGSVIQDNLKEILPPELQRDKRENRQAPKPKEVIKAFEGLFKNR